MFLKNAKKFILINCKLIYLIILFASFCKKKSIENSKVVIYTPNKFSGLGCVARNISYTVNKFKKENLIFDDTNILVGNPDVILSFVLENGLKNLLYKNNIGLWFWELENIPYKWQITSGSINEIWVISDYLKKIFKPLNSNIRKIPFYFSIPNFKFSEHYFGEILCNKFSFCFIFDFHSFFERKNPIAVVKAFLLNFTNSKNHILIIKTSNGKYHMDKLHILLEITKEHENIKIIDESMDFNKYYSLLYSIDCYVSLHRSEGFGLTLLEAMMLSKPVIATGYSGNLEFMNSGNSLLVNYKLVQSKKSYLYDTQSFWAEPDIHQAASYMKKISEDDKLAKMLTSKSNEIIRKYKSA